VVKRERLLASLAHTPYLATKGPFTRAPIDGILSHLLLIFTTPGLVNQLEAKHEVIFGQALLSELPNIPDTEILISLAEVSFVGTFCHLFARLDFVADIFQLLWLLVTVADLTPSQMSLNLFARWFRPPSSASFKG
jgi:hypothetical protein